ncbi:hypothetical protein [Paraburkholderia sp. BCC1885]|uniref:hypothetical protein n=1 Tax=Paraburkholderia sp. BCC1885 TaxID=2562669 RepID=UPI00118232E3|nr:hypothetical protein [Paraburkholderia sp. BCC1885]
MRHTVIGLFDTYAQAENARDTLVQTGFANDTIELQANHTAPSPTAATEAVDNGGVFGNIERFISSLFSREPRQAEADRYTEAVRRGAVLVCVYAASEAHAELASTTLTRLGATEIGERLLGRDAALDDPVASREHSMLDELGVSSANHGFTTARPVDEPLRGRAPMPVEPRAQDPLTPQPPLSEAATMNTIAAGSAPGFGAVFTPVDVAPAARHPESVADDTMPDEFLEYEEDFRSHYDEQYASDQARYEDYVPAYRYGATIARDLQYRDRPWDEVEPEARRHWESTSPEATDTWERFKLAVRHGWDRVTGHHHV